ncbi:carboxyl transferase domain-containing protein [Gordonia insulae]|uniref:Acetyl-coenzyme A carboxylase carboxyl transferase subunits beta/alpha n=1 Tax=Gordonia insulae TaxID=2420509 RepID=A0A3G8JJR3_9ACTN|nr:carboxyl transferase domain-containing protein [Gordonia insulae]AZG45274.1 Putative acetyl-coenzyme A carboxylase carboxyl transferase subunit beta [Gordonia insulae]
MTAHPRLDAAGIIAALLDTGTWQSWDAPVDQVPDDPDYRASLARARDKTGVDESVITGRGMAGGMPLAVVVSEFGFLGGSIGRSAGLRVVAAIERATRERLPVLALPASGGTRMQEGTAAFLQMVAITGAVNAHKAAGLAYLVYLRHPTTGGVFASWGSLGHVTWAEPSALVGFLGPRVYEGLYGEPFPSGVQTSENLLRHGLVDAVVAVADLRVTVGRTLARLGPDDPVAADVDVGAPPTPTADAWSAVQATRSADRPGLVEFLGEDSVVLRADAPVWTALHRFGGRTALIIGQDRRAQAAGELITPVDLRVARRGMRMAADLGLPVLTVIDTPGAELSVAAEEGGLATEIARCTAELVSLPVPTVSVLLGQGAGGAALALFPADRRIAAVDAWLSPLPPEGASLIVYRDTDHAAESARDQGIVAAALFADGTLDRLVEVAGPRGMADLRAVIAAELAAGPLPARSRRTRHPAPEGRDGAPTPVPEERARERHEGRR